ncbi:thioredoxin II, putative [Talaromyces stipitatus ATCC 10500]|uniref:Thioredoxin II, putative n=1 Tax=Talaromyces stipitatus (strain ATCC 10500 / CBS 375.48 / QM 6759 / NRRL 1006) TaxID=441959 RepID=B8MH13_TALSN|nr:thioredoxin II, putative [Talaromyces stipitatus ATCC 10500]EED16827.1 thioredoxin II, putative [Talaromyces stipitatus ATCC 10500]
MVVAELTSLSAYQEELQKPGVVVIDFYSPSCGPCKVVAPLFDKLATEAVNAHVRFFKVNGLNDQGSKIQEAAQVVWWPTFVIYKEGQEQWRAKVPNPPDQHPIAGLTSALEKAR